jgi:hypothetical protein
LATPLYLTFGALAGAENANNFVCPRAGIIRNLYVDVSTVTISTSLTFTVRRSTVCNGAFANTTISVTIVGAGCGNSNNAVAVNPGDRISLQVSALVGVTVACTAGLEYA